MRMTLLASAVLSLIAASASAQTEPSFLSAQASADWSELDKTQDTLSALMGSLKNESGQADRLMLPTQYEKYGQWWGIGAKIAETEVTARAFATPAKSVAPAPSQTVQPWMSADVGAAWSQGYKGQGTTITVVDDFKSSTAFYGDLIGAVQYGRHGQWTGTEAKLVAPSATVRALDYTTGRTVPLAKGLNVLNLSYGMMAPAGYSAIRWSAQETSIINYAKKGTAIISKAAGNDSGIAIGGTNKSGQVDYLGRDLIGAQSAIFVGALNTNGTPTAKASLASYSNIAGSNLTVQKQFLTVGVDANQTGLAGTSFAAPIITGYAAILGSKFTKATPTQITNQLLTTARTDTISGYSASVHGRGEASLSRALSPIAIK